MEKNKEHKDSSGSKTGTSKERTDWLGNKYTEHKDSSGSKTGTSEERTDWLGNKYTEHKDSSGSKTGTSEKSAQIGSATSTQNTKTALVAKQALQRRAAAHVSLQPPARKQGVYQMTVKNSPCSDIFGTTI